MQQLPQPDPRGVLALTELEPQLRDAEDARAIADWDVHNAFQTHKPIPGYRLESVYSSQDKKHLKAFTRPATYTERALLKALGHDLPSELVTAIHYRTATTRFRWWPQLEQSQPIEQEGDSSNG